MKVWKALPFESDIRLGPALVVDMGDQLVV